MTYVLTNGQTKKRFTFLVVYCCRYLTFSHICFPTEVHVTYSFCVDNPDTFDNYWYHSKKSNDQSFILLWKKLEVFVIRWKINFNLICSVEVVVDSNINMCWNPWFSLYRVSIFPCNHWTVLISVCSIPESAIPAVHS